MRARIFRSAKRVFDCKIQESGQMVPATALRELIKGREAHIVVGDEVELSKVEETGEYQIKQIYPRNNEIFRIIPREQKRKAIASNIDLMVIVMSVSKPEFKRGLLDRYLVRSIQWDVPALVVFNKMDEWEGAEIDLNFEKDRIETLVNDFFEVSAVDGSYIPAFLPNSMQELRTTLKGKIAIFMGQSGVGKSQLITALSGGEIELLSREIGKGGKGSHTTTWAEMVDCRYFLLIDSPGVRSFAMDDIILEDIDAYFPDLAQLFTKCKFTTCTHLENAKGCYFNDLDPEKRESQLILSRLETYLRLCEEVETRPSWAKHR